MSPADPRDDDTAGQSGNRSPVTGTESAVVRGPTSPPRHPPAAGTFGIRAR